MLCHVRSCAKSTKAAGGGFGGFCASWRQFTCSRCHVHHTFACVWVMFNVSLTTVLLIGQRRTQARSRDQVTRGGSSSRALRVAHGNGKTLLAQVLPCGMTKVFVKLRSLPETSIFNAASVKRFYISQRRTDKKLPSCMFPPTHKQFGCRSCGSSKVGCLGLPHSVPWWPVALATRHTLLIRRPRYYNGPNQPATTDIAPAIAQIQRAF